MSAVASTYIVGRLGFGPRKSVPLLDGLPLDQVIRGLAIFGRSELLREADLHDVMEAGFATIMNGDQRIDGLLQRIAAGRGERPGAKTAYGAVHAFARDLHDCSTRDQLLAIMAAHALNRRTSS